MDEHIKPRTAADLRDQIDQLERTYGHLINDPIFERVHDSITKKTVHKAWNEESKQVAIEFEKIMFLHKVKPIDEKISWLKALMNDQFRLPIWYSRRNYVPKYKSGCYIVVDHDGVEYVGESIDLFQRLNSSHPILRHHDLDRHWIGIIENYSQLDGMNTFALESLLIKNLSPRENKSYSKGAITAWQTKKRYLTSGVS